MIVDCGDCVMRDRACADCVVSVLLGVPDPSELGPLEMMEASDKGHLRIPLQQDEREAMAALAEGGLVPHLRLVSRTESDTTPDCLAAPTNDRSRRTG